MVPLTPREAAIQLAEWRRIRSDLTAWATYAVAQRKQVPAKHHRLMLSKIQAAIDGTLVQSKTGKPCKNLIIRLPPGSAKSTYSSVITPPWFMQKNPGSSVLACSYSADLSESFSRESRNLIEANEAPLDLKLEEDTRAVKLWSTTNGSKFRCLGVGSGIAGYRMDLGLIDDYLGSEEDADSKTIRDKQWNWYLTDFWPRFKPGATQIIIANRRHEDDLVGRILAKEEDEWEDIKIPFFAKEGDVLGRQPGERLWPEWFTEHMAEKVMQLPPRTRACLYDQEPAPEEGDYFKAAWMETYTREEYNQLMKKDLKLFGAGDWACGTDEESNRTCFGGAALDEDGILYILPDIFWKVCDSKETVGAFIDFLRRRQTLQFWSEAGQISKSWGPFLREQMLEEKVYASITEVTPSKNKEIRARSIQGRMSMLRVKFPAFAHWWPDAMHEMLMFPGGKNDDFVDFIAHLGMGINSMIRPGTPRAPLKSGLPLGHQPITLDWVKRSDKDSKKPQEKYGGR